MSIDVKIGDRIRAIGDSEVTVFDPEIHYFLAGDEGVVQALFVDDAEPCVEVQFENQTHQYRDGCWYITLSNLEVLQ